jgi:hypothetical protein
MAERGNYHQDCPLPLQNESALCKYPGKRCLNQRVVKSIGKLHNLCDQHHKNANNTQRKSQLTKRMKLVGTTGKSLRVKLNELHIRHWSDQSGVEWRCRYSKGQNCKSARTTKSNGERHRFCDYHARRAKVYQHKSVKKKRAEFSSTNRTMWDEGAIFTDQDFKRIGGMTRHEQHVLLAPHGLGYLAMGTPLNSFVHDTGNKDGVNILIGSVDNVQSHEPVVGIMDDLQDDELEIPRPHLPAWLPGFIDEVYASLAQPLQCSHTGSRAISSLG